MASCPPAAPTRVVRLDRPCPPRSPAGGCRPAPSLPTCSQFIQLCQPTSGKVVTINPAPEASIAPPKRQRRVRSGTRNIAAAQTGLYLAGKGYVVSVAASTKVCTKAEAMKLGASMK